MAQGKESYFIIIPEKNGSVTGHAMAYDAPDANLLTDLEVTKAPTLEDDKDSGLVPNPEDTTFYSVIESFVSVMQTYRDFVSFMLEVGGPLSAQLAASTIGEFAKQKGIERTDLAMIGRRVYELSVDSFREYNVHNDRVTAGLAGARHLPEVMVLGLISAYDAYLSRLLRVVIDRHQEIVLTSEKAIKFSELASYETIAAARDALIDREIEGVIRSSHHDQFRWMENNFKLKLRSDLLVWPFFVEVCERRNLITHTGGAVSQQYRQNCQENGHKGDLPKVGTKLKTDIEYFRNAVRSVHEIGLKLGHVLWRKFATEEQKDADIALNEHGMNLILAREYQLAEKLLAFGVKTVRNHPSDSTRRMMVINHANSLRLQDRKQDAAKIIHSEDWSASKREFSICVAAVSGDMKELTKLMRESGPSGTITAEDYRLWPVFRGMRLDADFMAAFQDIFGEPIKKSLPKQDDVTIQTEPSPLKKLH